MTEQRLQQITDAVRAMRKVDAMYETATAVRFTNLYRELFGDGICSTCTDKIGSAYDRILNLDPNQIFVMTNQNRFKLAGDNDVIDFSFNGIPGVPVHVTAANLTDAIAEKIIASNENFRKRFIERPAPPPQNDGADDDAGSKTGDDAATAAALEKVLSDNTKQQIIDLLVKQEIEHDAKLNKEELAKLLVAGQATQ